MTASVGVRRSPVSRLFGGGVGRSLIAYSSPTPLGSADGPSWCDPDHAAHRVAPIGTAVRRRSGGGDARAGGLCRTAATSDARDTRRHVNRRRRPLCRAGHEYADGDRQTRSMTSRLTGAAANPSRRGPRQPGRRRRFSPRGGGRAGRHGPPARASWRHRCPNGHESSLHCCPASRHGRVLVKLKMLSPAFAALKGCATAGCEPVLLAAQRDHRIDARRAARREVARDERHRRQQQRDTAANVSGSVAATPKSRLCHEAASARARRRGRAPTPTSATRQPLAQHQPRRCRAAVAPSAMRIPISRVPWLTRYAITP